MSLERGYLDYLTRRLQWFTDALQMNQSPPDTTLAIVLCMATKIQKIDIHHKSGSWVYCTTRNVLIGKWKGQNAPFGELRSLTLHGPGADDYVGPLLPTMTSVEMRNSDMKLAGDATILARPRPMPASPLLQRLVLTNISNFLPELLDRTIRSHSLHNIKELVVDRCGWVRSNTPVNLDRVVRALEEYTPDMVSLRWSSQRSDLNLSDDQSPQIISLKNLCKLRKLHVDFDSLVSLADDELATLSDLHTILPDRLEHLVVDGLHTRFIHRMVERFHKKIEDNENLSEEVAVALTLLASTFTPLNRLGFHIMMDKWVNARWEPCELEPSDIVFFRYAADVLIKKNLAFEIYRKPRDFEGEPKLLVEHGYSARQPHSFGELYESPEPDVGEDVERVGN